MAEMRLMLSSKRGCQSRGPRRQIPGRLRRRQWQMNWSQQDSECERRQLRQVAGGDRISLQRGEYRQRQVRRRPPRRRRSYQGRHMKIVLAVVAFVVTLTVVTSLNWRLSHSDIGVVVLAFGPSVLSQNARLTTKNSNKEHSVDDPRLVRISNIGKVRYHHYPSMKATTTPTVKLYCLPEEAVISFQDSKQEDFDQKTRSRPRQHQRSVSKQQRRRRNDFYPKSPSPESGSVDEWIVSVENLDSTEEIKAWIEKTESDVSSSSSPLETWNVKDVILFIKYLQQLPEQRRNKRRHHVDTIECIMSFLHLLDSGSVSSDFCTNHNDELIKIYTTALFALSQSGRFYSSKTTRNTTHDAAAPPNDFISCKARRTFQILDTIERKGLQPTKLTIISLFGCLHASGSDYVLSLYHRLSKTYPDIEWDVEMYNTAVVACKNSQRRHRWLSSSSSHAGANSVRGSSGSSDEKNWQAAMFLFQQLQRRRIKPNSKTYLALLEVISSTGKIPVVRSLIGQWQRSQLMDNRNSVQTGAEEQAKPENQIDLNFDLDFVDQQTKEHLIHERIWIAALNACNTVGDYRQALLFVKQMTESIPPTIPTLRHCSRLLMTFASAQQDQLALTTLQAMTGNATAILTIGNGGHVHIPRIDPDLVALNTVLKCLSSAGNYKEAQNLFDRMMKGEFQDPDDSEQKITPDRISYHYILTSCRDPHFAKKVIKSMRLSRRYRVGSVAPTNVSYAHAIHACHRTSEPDLESALELLRWAKDDRIEPTSFMYAPVIWTAQKCGDYSQAIELYGKMEDLGCAPNGMSMNGLICAVCGKGDEKLAIILLGAMKKRGLKIIPITIQRILAVLSSSELSNNDREKYMLRILDVLDDDELTVKVSGSLLEALITHYGRMGNIEKAIGISNRIRGHLNASCLRALLLAFSSTKPVRWQEAVELLHSSDITDIGLIDQVALGHALVACSKADQFEEGLTLLDLYAVHTDRISRRSQHLPVSCINSLIASAGRGGRADLSIALFNQITSLGLQPDGRSYRSVMIACNQAQHEQQRHNDSKSYVKDDDSAAVGSFEWWEVSLSLLRRMKEDGIVPDKQTYSSAISACEAAAQWQRALGVLQDLLDDSDRNTCLQSDQKEPLALNLYCWNGVISACQKGGAWVEALDLYERMLIESPRISPNFVTLNSLLEALDGAGQQELVQSKFEEALMMGIVNPWKKTWDKSGNPVMALDLHRFSKAMAVAAIRHVMDTWCDENNDSGGEISGDLHIITGKGIHSEREPVLQKAVIEVMKEYHIKALADPFNPGRVILGYQDLLDCFSVNSWR